MQEAALPIQSASGSYNAQAAGGSTAIVTVFQAAPPRPADPAEVAAAEALLAELPLDSLPEPSGLPAGSFMPWPRNRFFIGRKPVLRELAREIKQGGTTAVGRSPAVTSMGGRAKLSSRSSSPTALGAGSRRRVLGQLRRPGGNPGGGRRLRLDPICH
jgi:hypothetical protein